ncbi:MAG: TIGR01212 family radical SAM protein [Elusimicrobia bacterium]|nr:TIGR01212 family radical SAM protein [Candidatus Liberimonas magnetica]
MERYYKFSTYFKNIGYKEKILKITVDAGFTCPNRDGKISRDGCIYCNNEGFSPNTRKKLPVEEQISQGVASQKIKNKDARFLVYFQAYTNTYAPAAKLKEAYDNIRSFKDIAGIAVGTRPDCINEEKLQLINSYANDYEVWLEYGLQSMHDDTLMAINRGHTYEQFLDAIKLTRKYKKIKICVHVILGLPGENKDKVIGTAKALGGLQIDGIKIHPLHVIKNTKLEELYKEGKVRLLEQKEFAELTVSFLEFIWPKTVIQRISADCPKDLLVAPGWINDKSGTLNLIEKTMLAKNTFQGRYWK